MTKARTPSATPKSRAGFTLVELSVVLVILGLLVGGVLAGQSLIRAAELRKISTDIEKYRTTVNSFKEKYFFYPGDMPNATAFWGQQTESCYSEPTAGTCNGDGDGRMGTNPNWILAELEKCNGWVHMSKAGMIPGNYVGCIWDGSYQTILVERHVPRAPAAFGNSVFMFDYSTNSSIYPDAFLNKMFINYRRDTTATVNGYWGNLMPADAYHIDMKFDDGLPHSGQIGTIKKYSNWWIKECVTIDNGAYNITSTNEVHRCWSLFRL